MGWLELKSRSKTFAAFATFGVIVVVSAFTVARCAEPAKPVEVDEAFGQKVRAYLLSHPEVIEEAVEALKVKEQHQAELDASKAIGQNRDKLNLTAGDPSLGAGPVTLVEFFDYRCAYCKAAAPRIPGLVAENPNIRIVFKEFPILTEVSEHAARAALAAEAQGKYMPVHLAFMAEKALDDAAIDRILREKGVDLDRAHADMKSAAIAKKIEDNKALAHAVGVDGTPGFVVGDKLIGGFVENDILAAVKSQSDTTPKTGT